MQDTTKVEVHGHGSAGYGFIVSDFWAYNFENRVPCVFGTDAIANLLRHCKKQPEVELKVCESAKDAVDEKGETQQSLLDRLDEALKSGVGERDPPSLSKKLKVIKIPSH